MRRSIVLGIGIALAAVVGGILVLVSESTAPPPTAPLAPSSKTSSRGLFPVPFKRGNLVGYEDHQGRVEIEPRFLWGGSFSRGYARVWIGTAEGARTGLIDLEGRFVVPAKYTECEDYSANDLVRCARLKVARWRPQRVEHPLPELRKQHDSHPIVGLMQAGTIDAGNLRARSTLPRPTIP